MAHGFHDPRIFISAPGDLDHDREACHSAIARVNETIAMPAKVLLVSVFLRDNDHLSTSRSIVSDNVRWSSYFIQIFEDDWGPRDLFRKLFLLAIDCRRDASLPMRDVIVFLKDAPQEANPEILTFRKELEDCPDVRVFHYATIDDLRVATADVCGVWASDQIESLRAAGPQTPVVAET